MVASVVDVVPAVTESPIAVSSSDPPSASLLAPGPTASPVSVPLCYAGRDDKKCGFVFERSTESVGGSVSTVLHVSSCLIHKIAMFESLFVVACNGNQIAVWDKDDDQNFTEVGVFELPGFDLESDLVIALSAFRDQASLSAHHKNVSVIKVESCAFLLLIIYLFNSFRTKDSCSHRSQSCLAFGTSSIYVSCQGLDSIEKGRCAARRSE